MNTISFHKYLEMTKKDLKSLIWLSTSTIVSLNNTLKIVDDKEEEDILLKERDKEEENLYSLKLALCAIDDTAMLSSIKDIKKRDFKISITDENMSIYKTLNVNRMFDVLPTIKEEKFSFSFNKTESFLEKELCSFNTKTYLKNNLEDMFKEP